MIGTYEPPLSVIGSVCDFSLNDPTEQIAPGVRGQAFELDGRIFIPLIVATQEGNGDVGRFLDSLTQRCVIVNVTSSRLRGMLVRRGWKETFEPSDDGDVDIWSRRF